MKKDIEQRNGATGIVISQDQFLGEGQYAEIKVQVEYDDATLMLGHIASLSVWAKVDSK